MFDTEERLNELEAIVGQPRRHTFARVPDFSERLDKLEEFMYRMKNWCQHVEQQLGVVEILNNKQEYEFLGTKKTPLRGHYDHGQK